MLYFESNIDTDSSYNTMMKAGDGKVFVQAYATSGIVAATPMLVRWGGSGFIATTVAGATGHMGFIGVPTKALGSGCVGWVQVRGKVEDVKSHLSSEGGFHGEQGHAIVVGATATSAGLHATGAANIMSGVTGQVGVLLEEATTTLSIATVWLTGVYGTVADLG